MGKTDMVAANTTQSELDSLLALHRGVFVEVPRVMIADWASDVRELINIVHRLEKKPSRRVRHEEPSKKKRRKAQPR